jgi:hypothetical protein
MKVLWPPMQMVKVKNIFQCSLIKKEQPMCFLAVEVYFHYLNLKHLSLELLMCHSCHWIRGWRSFQLSGKAVNKCRCCAGVGKNTVVWHITSFIGKTTVEMNVNLKNKIFNISIRSKNVPGNGKSFYIQTDFIFKVQLLLYVLPAVTSETLYPVHAVCFWILYDS